MHVRAWKTAYRGLLPDAYLDALDPEDRVSRFTFGSRDPSAPQTIVAIVDDALVGFATTGLSQDADLPNAGELRALYVDPPCWRAGIGRTLLIEARHALVATGRSEALLWVLAGHEPAARFYRADGWRSDGPAREADHWGITVQVVRYRRALV